MIYIVTGLSGAGKKTVMQEMEQLGFRCLDNFPVNFLKNYLLCCNKEENIAFGIDCRGEKDFSLFPALIQEVEEADREIGIIYTDSSEGVLVSRFKETRAAHPLSHMKKSLLGAIQEEKEIMKTMMNLAKKKGIIIDTSSMETSELKEIIREHVGHDREFTIRCMSFGFKHGIPLDADIVFDVRCFKNPYYEERLRNRTGLDKEVKDFVLSYQESRMFVLKLWGLINYLLPLYKKEGKHELVIAIGCTGGHHRSVCIAQELYENLKKEGNMVSIIHRDIKN